WAAVRFGTTGATGATLLVSSVAVWTTVAGRGPFIRPELHQSLGVLQAFMSVVAVTFLVLGAMTAERRRTDRERAELFHRERAARAPGSNRGCSRPGFAPTAPARPGGGCRSRAPRDRSRPRPVRRDRAPGSRLNRTGR